MSTCPIDSSNSCQCLLAVMCNRVMWLWGICDMFREWNCKLDVAVWRTSTAINVDKSSYVVLIISGHRRPSSDITTTSVRYSAPEILNMLYYSAIIYCNIAHHQKYTVILSLRKQASMIQIMQRCAKYKRVR